MALGKVQQAHHAGLALNESSDRRALVSIAGSMSGTTESSARVWG